MSKTYLLVISLEEENEDIKMTEILGTFEELNLDTTYATNDEEERQTLQQIEHLRDYGTVGEVFEWCVNPISGESAELTRIS
jgi:hypothetical protein|tara:strand:- start:3959 stop:4204 length:246 start_codon:yes stop_codon:yes gene_type:complete